jgi:hypothetical protein
MINLFLITKQYKMSYVRNLLSVTLSGLAAYSVYSVYTAYTAYSLRATKSESNKFKKLFDLV